jgi:hypothetical protein
MIDAGIGANSALDDNYVIDNSIQSNSVSNSNPPRFNRTNSGTGNRKTFTISFWHKKGNSSHSNGISYTFINSIRNESGKYPGLFLMDTRPVDTVKTVFTNYFADEDANNVQESNTKTVASYKDHSAWYHIVMAFDTTQSAAADRKAMYVNGVEQTFTQNQDLPQHQQSSWNDDTLHCIGAYEYNLPNPTLGGYMAEVHNIDGLKLDASYFGEFDTSGIWKPKEYDGNYGTNGFRLQFKETGTSQNASGLGADTSGNDHHFATVGHTAASQATDTPTNNFCTWNPLWVYATQPTISDGATKTFNSSTDWTGAKSTFGLTKGKWYWEYKALIYNALLGIQTDGESNISASGNAQSKLSTMALFLQGEVEAFDVGGNRDDTNVTFTFNAAHTFGIALDMESSTQTISFYQNGSLITNGGSINIDGLADKTVFPFVATLNNTVTINFGGYTSNSISSAASDANGYGTFEHAPPSGYYALCTKNLAEYG